MNSPACNNSAPLRRATLPALVPAKAPWVARMAVSGWQLRNLPTVAPDYRGILGDSPFSLDI